MKLFNRQKHPSRTLIELTGITFMFGGLVFGHYVIENIIVGLLVGIAVFLALMVVMAKWGQRKQQSEGNSDQNN